jgi:hypothetical protein
LGKGGSLNGNRERDGDGTEDGSDLNPLSVSRGPKSV